MSWSVEPFIGDAGNLTDHEFTVVTGDSAHEINERENAIIEKVKDGIEGIAEATGGFLSISAYGSHSQIPSPGDTTVIYISYLPNPQAATAASEAQVAGDGGDTMTTQEALNVQAAEAAETHDPGDQEGLAVGDAPEVPTEPIAPGAGVVEQAPVETVAVADPSDPSIPPPATPVGDPPPPAVPPELQVPPVDPTVPAPSAPASTPDGSTPSPVDPSAAQTPPDLTSGASGSPAAPPASDPSVPPVDTSPPPSGDPSAVAPPADPSIPAVPEAAPVVTQQAAGQVTSLETGAGIGPDEAAARVAAQLAENPVAPKPLYWVDAGVAIDAALWPTANVLAANGAVLYNYAQDQPGGAPTGAPDGGPWHVYEGATQPAPGTPEAAVAAAQAPAADTAATTPPAETTPSA